MDTLTHSLVAVALCRAGLRRVLPQATLLLIISANIPDIDVLSIARSQLSDLEIHRGYTHALVGMPVLALLSVLLTRLITLRRFPFPRAFFISLLGVGSHVLLDCTGSFGIRPFLPFSSQWLYLDLNGFYDGVILTLLALAFLWPWFVGLVSSEMGKNAKHPGQGSAILVILLLLLYEGGRWGLHQRALNELNSRLYDGEVPLAISALGQPNNPFQWTGIVETQSAFRLIKTGSLDLDNREDAQIFRKPPITQTYLNAMHYEPFRYMAYFSRFPVWDIQPVKLNAPASQLVDLTDLRFGTPGAGQFHTTALADANGKILQTQFGFTLTLSEEHP